MPNRFEHPLHGEQTPQAIQTFLEVIAAQEGAVHLHQEQLRRFRTNLQRWADPVRIWDGFAFSGSEEYPQQSARTKAATWERCWTSYIVWRMANDDEFWMAMERGVEENYRQHR